VVFVGFGSCFLIKMLQCCTLIVLSIDVLYADTADADNEGSEPVKKKFTVAVSSGESVIVGYFSG